MSAYVSGLVWRHYSHGGARLLAMLAVADYADDDGTGVYPSAARLARKIRVEERSARRLLAAMRDDGDIVAVGQTARGVTVYRIDLDRLRRAGQQDAQVIPPDRMSGGDLSGLGPLTGESGTPDPQVRHSPSGSPSSSPPLLRGGSELEWPTQLTPAARAACQRELTHCMPEHHASIVRELTHRLSRAHDPLRIPYLWVRTLVRAAQTDTLVRLAPAAPLSAAQRTAIEQDYQRRIMESRRAGETFRRARGGTA